MINTGRRPCNYDRLDSASTPGSRRGGRGDATRSRQTVLDVLVSWMNTAGFLPSSEACSSLPTGIFGGSAFTCSEECCFCRRHTSSFGLAASSSNNTLSQCVTGFQQECKRTEAGEEEAPLTSKKSVKKMWTINNSDILKHVSQLGWMRFDPIRG